MKKNTNVSQYSKCGALPWIDGGVMVCLQNSPKYTMEKFEIEFRRELGSPIPSQLITLIPLFFFDSL